MVPVDAVEQVIGAIVADVVAEIDVEVFEVEPDFISDAKTSMLTPTIITTATSTATIRTFILFVISMHSEKSKFWAASRDSSIGTFSNSLIHYMIYINTLIRLLFLIIGAITIIGAERVSPV